ncbi:hypothetical protein ON058_05605 [Demequina sp. B12]|uniref:hypothetical protein n=1 Tax=Demequina sp. B12 TaxID=2992757 RepID=UPI00237A8604|nr:hypothetical protein [Demequina sp. B12]MDE0572887.1 hypothetical protein [Demequina sp. B12]
MSSVFHATALGSSGLDAAVLASSGGGDDFAFIALFAFVAPFVAFWLAYTMLFKRYRNQDKRYQYEHTTHSTIDELQRWDTFTRERRRLRNRFMDGSNLDDPDQRAGYVDIKEMDGLPPEASGDSAADAPDGGSDDSRPPSGV